MWDLLISAVHAAIVPAPGTTSPAALRLGLSLQLACDALDAIEEGLASARCTEAQQWTILLQEEQVSSVEKQKASFREGFLYGRSQ